MLPVPAAVAETPADTAPSLLCAAGFADRQRAAMPPLPRSKTSQERTAQAEPCSEMPLPARLATTQPAISRCSTFRAKIPSPWPYSRTNPTNFTYFAPLIFTSGPRVVQHERTRMGFA